MSLTGQPGGPPDAGRHLDRRHRRGAVRRDRHPRRARTRASAAGAARASTSRCSTRRSRSSRTRSRATSRPARCPGRSARGIPRSRRSRRSRPRDGCIVVAAGNDALFAKLCARSGARSWRRDPRFASNELRTRPRRRARRSELEQALAARAAATGSRRSRRAGVPCGPVNDVAQVVADPQVARAQHGGGRRPAWALRDGRQPDQALGLPGPAAARRRARARRGSRGDPRGARLRGRRSRVDAGPRLPRTSTSPAARGGRRNALPARDPRGRGRARRRVRGELSRRLAARARAGRRRTAALLPAPRARQRSLVSGGDAHRGARRRGLGAARAARRRRRSRGVGARSRCVAPRRDGEAADAAPVVAVAGRRARERADGRQRARANALHGRHRLAVRGPTRGLRRALGRTLRAGDRARGRSRPRAAAHRGGLPARLRAATDGARSCCGRSWSSRADSRRCSRARSRPATRRPACGCTTRSRCAIAGRASCCAARAGRRGTEIAGAGFGRGGERVRGRRPARARARLRALRRRRRADPRRQRRRRDQARAARRRSAARASGLPHVAARQADVRRRPRERARRERIAGLAAEADVVLSSFTPGVDARFGLDPAAIAARNPRAITCRITGFGPRGPYAHYPAWDGLVAAKAGPHARVLRTGRRRAAGLRGGAGRGLVRVAARAARDPRARCSIASAAAAGGSSRRAWCRRSASTIS